MGIGVAIAILISVAAISAGADDSLRSGWKQFHHENGWRLEYPDSWHAQRVDAACRLEEHGVLVTNAGRDFTRPPLPETCGSLWDFRGLPESVVAVEFVNEDGGPVDLRPEETEFPLSLEKAARAEVDPGFRFDTPTPFYYQSVFAQGERLRLRAWIGKGAGANDVDAAREIVRSIEVDK